jgi:hypothetical protein
MKFFSPLAALTNNSTAHYQHMSAVGLSPSIHREEEVS